ncbi:hypothetical protein C1878_13825 [Gordonibacter sp. 28C]|uniref:zinc-ribbon domain-containing protein n=1 Tax=Gordonibacter sp. 28C TaxID=2078569 RepID=UPI000DF7DD4A|nr:zinc-ribbon domain-containing protein [Gordonibacter sp. 28C]RDB60528.1 hypothetical protein C1878_13825 [Gordonibacter sp. 28C]
MCFRPPSAGLEPVKCPKCGALVPPSADACPSCGARADMPAPGVAKVPSVPKVPKVPNVPKPPVSGR